MPCHSSTPKSTSKARRTHGVPRDVPAHPRLHPRDVRLRPARGVDERGVAGVQMGEVADVVGHQRAADTAMLGPPVHAGVDEGAVDDQLAAAVEQVEQAHLALGPLEHVLLLHRRPRHPPAHRGQRITRAGQLLLLDEHAPGGRPPTPAPTRSGVSSLVPLPACVFQRSTCSVEHLMRSAHHGTPAIVNRMVEDQVLDRAYAALADPTRRATA